MSVEEIIGQRIEQLDAVYSFTSDVRLKAFVLSQMIMLAKTIGVEVLKEDEELDVNDKTIDYLTAIINNALLFTHQFIKQDSIRGFLPDIAKMIKYMDRIRATLLYELVDRGIIKKFREIPIAFYEDTLREDEL